MVRMNTKGTRVKERCKLCNYDALLVLVPSLQHTVKGYRKSLIMGIL